MGAQVLVFYSLCKMQMFLLFSLIHSAKAEVDCKSHCVEYLKDLSSRFLTSKDYGSFCQSDPEHHDDTTLSFGFCDEEFSFQGTEMTCTDQCTVFVKLYEQKNVDCRQVCLGAPTNPTTTTTPTPDPNVCQGQNCCLSGQWIGNLGYCNELWSRGTCGGCEPFINTGSGEKLYCCHEIKAEHDATINSNDQAPVAQEPVEVSNAEEPVEVSNAEEPVEVSNAEEPVEVSNAEEPVEVSNAGKVCEGENCCGGGKWISSPEYCKEYGRKHHCGGCFEFHYLDNTGADHNLWCCDPGSPLPPVSAEEQNTVAVMI